MPIDLKPISARKALSLTYGSNIAVNPYQGCVFACSFCSAIKMNYFTGRTKQKWDATGWGEWLDYKTDLIDLLHKEKRLGQKIKNLLRQCD